jgi:BioD-like phosphotransacetylase family protein
MSKPRSMVAMQISTHVKKLIHIEAVKRETTIGSIMSEAALAWIKFLRKIEMDEKIKKNDLSEMERLKKELYELQEALDEVVNARKTGHKTWVMKKEKRWKK